MKGFGLIYQNTALYRATMFALYRSEYQKKYLKVADAVPEGASVIDLCCGDCRIAPMLQAKRCSYLGIDVNPSFAKWATKRGILVRLADVSEVEIPKADVICIQSSLYQFMPFESKLLKRMIRSAKQRIIISEPVSNLTKGSGIISSILTHLTRVAGRKFNNRHTEQSLRDLILAQRTKTVKFERVGKEVLVIIDL